jgi:hypothetical protein
MTEVKRRMIRDELRELLLTKGRTILHEEGLGTGAGSLSFKKVFDRVEVDTGIRLTNASVIRRIWRNQAEYQTDVLAAVAEDESAEELDLTVGAVAPLMAAFDLTTPESRDAALRELCRVGGAANVDTVRKSEYWPLSIAIWALAVFDDRPDHRSRMEEALGAGYEAFTQQTAEVYSTVAAVVGIRLRESFTMEQFAIAVDAFGEGCGMRDRIDGRKMGGIRRNTGPGGEPQTWTLFAVGFEALVRQFFELDPNWDAPADAAL